MNSKEYNPLTTGHAVLKRSLVNHSVFVMTVSGAKEPARLTKFFKDTLFVPVRFVDESGVSCDGWASGPALRLKGESPLLFQR